MGAAPVNVVIKSSGAMDVVTPIENIGAGVPMVLGRYGQSVPLELTPNVCRRDLSLAQRSARLLEGSES